MEPLLRDGASIEVSNLKYYLPGDVVLVDPGPGRFTYIHRLIGFYPRKCSLRYLTQADNLSGSDSAIGHQQIIGKVTGGDCSHALQEIPIAHRLWALGRFSKFLTYRFIKSWSSLKAT